MTYSCAMCSLGGTTLEEAQGTKLDLVCMKLGLQRASGCSTSAAAGARSRCTRRREHGVHVTGITL